VFRRWDASTILGARIVLRACIDSVARLVLFKFS
jgi:hypothetical protein